jgi:HEPN domain
LDADKHLAQAERNEETANFLDGAGHNDWQCTALFYAALHYVKAYFKSKKPPEYYDSHPAIETGIRLDAKIKSIYNNYASIRSSSESARYHGWMPSDKQVKDEVLNDLKIIKKQLHSYVPKIKV